MSIPTITIIPVQCNGKPGPTIYGDTVADDTNECLECGYVWWMDDPNWGRTHNKAVPTWALHPTVTHALDPLWWMAVLEVDPTVPVRVAA